MKKIRTAIRERRALNSFVSGDYSGAEKHFTALEKIDPHRSGLNHNLGLTAMALGRYEEAEKRFLRDHKDLGDYYPRIRVMADLYYIWGKREQAEIFYRKALENSPPDGSRRVIMERISITADPEMYEYACESAGLYAEGNILLEDKRYEDALKLFLEALEKDKTNLPALNNIGVIQMNYYRDYSSAAETFEKGLELENLEWLEANLEKAKKALAGQKNKR